MDRGLLLSKIFWNLQANWHLRHRPDAQTLSVQETVKGLQRLLLTEQGALLQRTLQLAYARCVSLEALSRLDITLYQKVSINGCGAPRLPLWMVQRSALGSL